MQAEGLPSNPSSHTMSHPFVSKHSRSIARRYLGDDVSSSVHRQKLVNEVRPVYPRAASHEENARKEKILRGTPLGPSKSLPSPLIALLDESYLHPTKPRSTATPAEDAAALQHSAPTLWNSAQHMGETFAVPLKIFPSQASEGFADCAAASTQACCPGKGLPLGISRLDRQCTTPASSGGTPPPTEFPSGAILAELLVAYHRQLEQQHLSGDMAAAAGAYILGRVRAGLENLVGDPCHGASPYNSTEWHEDEVHLEGFLREIEKDVSMMEHYHKEKPTSFALAFTGMHCLEAARLLRKL